MRGNMYQRRGSRSLVYVSSDWVSTLGMGRRHARVRPTNLERHQPAPPATMATTLSGDAQPARAGSTTGGRPPHGGPMGFMPTDNITKTAARHSRGRRCTQRQTPQKNAYAPVRGAARASATTTRIAPHAELVTTHRLMLCITSSIRGSHQFSRSYTARHALAPFLST